MTCDLAALTVLSSLPAPVNVSVDSVNFHHVLRWDPAPGTPQGAEYRISRRVQGTNRIQVLKSRTASRQLKLDKNKLYYLSVKASYNQTLSPDSHTVNFSPYKDTKIGPPELSVAGCGNCIQINMSLPEADKSSGISDIHKYYDVHFNVTLRKTSGKPELRSSVTRNKSFTLNNLQEGVEYCVQVHTKIRLNQNTKPTPWKCTFTGSVERRDPVVLGAVAALLIVVMGVLITSVFCLHYTGFLCKLKATLPTAVIMALSQGYILTPEGTIPEPVCISSEKDKHKTQNNPTAPHPVIGDEDEDEDEEEEEGINVYMDRDAQLSSGDSLVCHSGNMSGHSEPTAPGDCGSLLERLPAEQEVPDAQFEGGVQHGGLDEGETKEKVSVKPEGGQTGFQGYVTGEEKEEDEEKEIKEEIKEQGFDSSGNVNLFSVTLAALGAGEEEEEEEEQSIRDCLTDFWKPGDLEPRLFTVPHTDSQTDDQTTVEVTQPTHKVFSKTGYEGRCTGYIRACDTQHEEEEEEEEEEDKLFTYMAHT
ncbi:cytokine receptor family member b1 isoform X2 [Trachinotus anak]|uniref:cytokine receptor family member b1 isoform X2 n=1 Tax=Trachinotus anak TaxID=443729 RepID=UPI0039F241D3